MPHPNLKAVLGIDSSLTATGLCLVSIAHAGVSGESVPVDIKIQVCTVNAPKPTKDKSHRAMSRRVSVLIDQIDGAMSDDIDLVVIEALAYGAKGAGAYVLPWVWGRIIDCAEIHDTPVLVVGTSQVKKYATGKGNVDKDHVLAAAIRRFPDIGISNNNEGDAAIIAAIGCRYLGYPIEHPTVAIEQVMAKLEPAA